MPIVRSLSLRQLGSETGWLFDWAVGSGASCCRRSSLFQFTLKVAVLALNRSFLHSMCLQCLSQLRASLRRVIGSFHVSLSYRCCRVVALSRFSRQVVLFLPFRVVPAIFDLSCLLRSFSPAACISSLRCRCGFGGGDSVAVSQCRTSRNLLRLRPFLRLLPFRLFLQTSPLSHWHLPPAVTA